MSDSIWNETLGDLDNAYQEWRSALRVLEQAQLTLAYAADAAVSAGHTKTELGRRYGYDKAPRQNVEQWISKAKATPRAVLNTKEGEIVIRPLSRNGSKLDPKKREVIEKRRQSREAAVAARERNAVKRQAS